jgi:hypothetical protein
MAAITPIPESSSSRSMKRPGLTLHLLSATLFLALTASRSAAQENMMAPAGGKPAKSSAGAKSADQTAELMTRFDQDADGLLDDAERAALKQYLKERPTPPAPATVAKAGPAMKAAAPTPEKFRAQLLELFDRNKDGRLDETERAAAQKFNSERGGELRDELLKRFDKNGNGRLDDDERPAAQELIRRRIAERTAATTVPAPAEKADEMAAKTALTPDENKNLESIAAEVAKRRKPKKDK